MYRNSEGYADPVAGAAMASVMREYRQNQREIRRQNERIKERPRVYIVSKYAGDVEKNVEAAQFYCKAAIRQNR